MATEPGPEHSDAQEPSVVPPYDIPISPTRSGPFFSSLGNKRVKVTQSRAKFLRQDRSLVDNSRKVLSLSTRDVGKDCTHDPLGPQKHPESKPEGHDNAESAANTTSLLQTDAVDPPPTPTPTALSPAATPVSAHALETGGPTLKGMRVFNQTIDNTVRERFRCVHEKLEPALLALLHKKRIDFRPLSLEILVLGHTPNDAKPWIVVRCSRAAKRKIKSFLREDFIKNLCQGPSSCSIRFEIIVTEAFVQITSDKCDEVFTKQEDLELREVWTPRIKVFHSGEARFATMGGIIRIVDSIGEEKFYGLTAGHVLPADNLHDEGLYKGGSSTTSDDDDNYEDDEQDKSGDENENESRPSAGYSQESLVGMRNMASSTEAPILEGEDDEKSSSIGDEVHWVSLGTMSKASYSPRARNRDWALIEVNGILSGQYKCAAGYGGLIGAVRPTQDQHVTTRNTSEYHCVVQSLPARAILPSGHKFVDIHVLKLTQIAVPPVGYSGTWIVDSKQNNIWTRVYGTLVATDALGNLWMVPMTDILNDVKDEFKATEVGLVNRVEETGIDHGRPPWHVRTDQSIAAAHSAHSVATQSVYPDNGTAVSGRCYDAKPGIDLQTVWYCSECQDGPYSLWQNVCQSCSHARCSFCEEEFV
ncbi:hypothetical protein HBH76_157280 [Parastagonospora nodorum]|nr:hypothetical protein HBH76_157280 [Parastagonospora nodorum]